MYKKEKKEKKEKVYFGFLPKDELIKNGFSFREKDRR